MHLVSCRRLQPYFQLQQQTSALLCCWGPPKAGYITSVSLQSRSNVAAEDSAKNRCHVDDRDQASCMQLPMTRAAVKVIGETIKLLGRDEAYHPPLWHPPEGPEWSPPVGGTAGTRHPGCCGSIVPHAA